MPGGSQIVSYVREMGGMIKLNKWFAGCEQKKSAYKPQTR
jgi:hypothetical protein